MLRIIIGFCPILLMASLCCLSVQANASTNKGALTPDECYETLSAIAAGERQKHKASNAFVYLLTGDGLETVFRNDSAWLRDQPKESNYKFQLMKDMGFRSDSLRFNICFIENAEEHAGECMVGMVREDFDAEDATEGLRVAVELSGGTVCNVLRDQM